MFQTDSLSHPFGGGGLSRFWPKAPEASSLLATVGMFGPSGGEACAEAVIANIGASKRAIVKARNTLNPFSKYLRAKRTAARHVPIGRLIADTDSRPEGDAHCAGSLDGMRQRWLLSYPPIMDRAASSAACFGIVSLCAGVVDLKFLWFCGTLV
jgi:hypothetical protein